MEDRAFANRSWGVDSAAWRCLRTPVAFYLPRQGDDAWYWWWFPGVALLCEAAAPFRRFADERGNDGASLWQESVTGNAWVYAVPTDDLNGDKTADVLITTSDWGTGTFTVNARKGSDGTSLWEASSNNKIWGASVGDLDRDRRENALVITYDALYAVGTPKFGKFRPIYS